MPSPIGHAMAGAMVAWIAELQDRRAATPAIAVPTGRRASQGRGRNAGAEAATASSEPAPASSWARLWSVGAALLTPLTVTCAVLAISPDFDNLFHTHRTYSHSLGAAGIVWVLVAFVAWRLRLPVVRTATICASAYASHVLLDWLGRDDSLAGGLMVLWPATTHFYSSGANLFLELVPHRRYGILYLLVANAHAIARETLILAPPFLVVLALRARSLVRSSPSCPAAGSRPSPAVR